MDAVPERRSRVCRGSLLSPAAHACTDTASCLWHDLLRSSEPTHTHLSTTHTPDTTSRAESFQMCSINLYKWTEALSRWPDRWDTSENTVNRMQFNEISTDPPRCRISCCRSRSCLSAPCAPPAPRWRRRRADLCSSHCAAPVEPRAGLTGGLTEEEEMVERGWEADKSVFFPVQSTYEEF